MGRLFFKWLLSSLKGRCFTELSMRVLVLSRNFHRTCSVSFHYCSAICWLLLTNLIMVGQIVCEIYSVPFLLFLQTAICASHVLCSKPTTDPQLPKTQLKQESPVFSSFHLLPGQHSQLHFKLPAPSAPLPAWPCPQVVGKDEEVCGREERPLQFAVCVVPMASGLPVLAGGNSFWRSEPDAQQNPSWELCWREQKKKRQQRRFRRDE